MTTTTRRALAALIVPAAMLAALTACSESAADKAADSSAAAAQETQDNEKTLREACEKSVKVQLKDPDSAEFSNWDYNWHPTAKVPAEFSFNASAGDQYVIVIGSVNAKNSFGGYGGAEAFAGDAVMHGNGHFECDAHIVDPNATDTDTPDTPDDSGGN